MGHRPVINGGRRAADRSEWLPLRARLGEKADDALALPGMGAFDRFLGDEEPQRMSGRPVTLEARPRLYGPDQVYRARSRNHSSQKAPGGGRNGRKGT
ncbi:hypothetical protein ACFQ2B_15020 [Streptomyces stramineus]